MRFSELDITKTYTYSDYLKWTFDERLKLVKGKIFKISAAPGSIHQLICSALFVELHNYLKGKECKVFFAPFDARLTRRSSEDKYLTKVLQPDICVICDRSEYDDKGGIGAPDILVEVFSPGDNKKELQNKYEVYEEAGVLEYWIVYPAEQTLTKCVLVENRFRPSRPYTVGDEITTPILPGFVLSLDDLFKDATC